MHTLIYSFQKHTERLILSFVLSLLITYFFKEPVSLFLLMGKSLSGRNSVFQVFFFLFFLTVTFAFLYFVLGKVLDWLIQHYFFSAAILALIPLAAYSIIGSYSRFVADDYSSATLAVSKGVFGATWDWYIHWSGRFTASFFDSLTGYLGPGIMPFAVGSAIIFWLVALITVFRNVFQNESKINRLAFSILLSALILITTFEVTPLLSQSLYWGQGMRSVILPLIPATFLLSIHYYLINVRKSPSAVWFWIVGITSFIAGGFGETYVVLQTAGYLLLLILTFFDNPDNWRKNALPAILVGLLSSIAAMGITIAAPGNKIRQAYFPPAPDVFNLLLISANSFWDYLQFLGASSIRIVQLMVLFLSSMIVGWVHTANSVQPEHTSTRYQLFHFVFHSYWKTFLFLAVISLGLLFVCFAPAAYGMSTSPPERTLVIPTYLLAVYLAALGVVSGKFLSISVKSKMRLDFQRPDLRVFAWVVILLFVLYIYTTSSQILSVQADYRHFATVFDRADSMIRQAKAEGKESVKVPEVHNHFGLSDFGAGTTYWLDEAVDSYYGISVIVNKNMK